MPTKAKPNVEADASPDAETTATSFNATTLAPIVQMPDVRTQDTAVVITALKEPFPQEMLRFNQAKGLTYVPISEVIARLNRVLGIENWSYEVVRVWRENDHPLWCLAHVRLHVSIGGKTIFREGLGGQQVKLTKKDQTPVDLGDEFKGAVSDALKKAAQSLGVALELARTEEAKRWEEEVENEIKVSPADEKAYADLLAILGGFSADDKAALRSWWDNSYGSLKVGPEAGVGKLNQAIAFANSLAGSPALTANEFDTAEDLIKSAFPGSTMAEVTK